MDKTEVEIIKEILTKIQNYIKLIEEPLKERWDEWAEAKCYYELINFIKELQEKNE